MEITVLPNQSILDVSLLHTGSVENAFEIAFKGGFSVSDDIEKGRLLIVPDTVKLNKQIITFNKMNQNIPATDIIAELIEIKPLEGVGYWEIENNFEIE